MAPHLSRVTLARIDAAAISKHKPQQRVRCSKRLESNDIQKFQFRIVESKEEWMVAQ